VPFSGSTYSTTLRLAGAPDSPGVHPFVADVSASFFDAAGIRLVRGRWFDDRASNEIVINQALASRLWPSGDPLGARVISGDFSRLPHVVVGIAGDTAYRSLRQGSDPFLFRPSNGGTILVRTAGPATSVVRSAIGAVARVDPRVVVSARPLADGISDELDAGRRVITIAAAVGLLALFVALGGIGANAAQSVAQRTHEIGIRMALGARRRDAVAFIVRRVLTPVAIGATAGIVIAAQAARLLAAPLYGVSPIDPPALVTSVLFVTAAATVAAWLPARRAASVDPVLALRSDG
jgi:hypothetical protein